MNHSTMISENVTITCITTDTMFLRRTRPQKNGAGRGIIRTTSKVAVIIQAVSPLFGTGAGAAAAAAGCSAAAARAGASGARGGAGAGAAPAGGGGGGWGRGCGRWCGRRSVGGGGRCRVGGWRLGQRQRGQGQQTQPENEGSKQFFH